MLTKEQATKIANDVVKQIGGAPWTPFVWENLGWCASAEWQGGYLGDGGGLTLYIHIHGRSRSYSVMGINRTLGDGRTPMAAIRRAHAELVRVSEEADGLKAPLWSSMKKGKRP